jgi:hypothetical protein
MSPLNSAQIDRISEATGILETPDSALPSLWTMRAEEANASGQEGSGLLETILNLIVIIFLVWVVLLVLRRPTADAMDNGPQS